MTRLSPDLLRRFDVNGSCYTSYPTADRFVEAFTETTTCRRWRTLRTRAQPPIVAVYPYPVLRIALLLLRLQQDHHQASRPAAAYLRYLAREVDLHTEKLGTGQPVTQLHLGGGTPTFLSDDELCGFHGHAASRLLHGPGGEYSIEVDPRTIDGTRLQTLADLGFNCSASGAGFRTPEVQKAVHRIQPAEQVFKLVEQARAIGFDSVNVDLIYGLPKVHLRSPSRGR